MHLDGYSHFCLRDADTSRDDLLCRLGLMADDYQPKPAFRIYCRLIAAHSS